MDHYIDITVKPHEEMRKNVLMNQLYEKLHKALFSLNSIDIGISFPRYHIMLGNTLRIHATKTRLLELQNMKWSEELANWCHISEIASIPENVRYRKISRKQSNMTQAKLNRLIKRGSIARDEINNYKAKMFEQGIDNPYLELKSNSNGHQHRRYFSFGEILMQPIKGSFDHFGLSKEATIPWF